MFKRPVWGLIFGLTLAIPAYAQNEKPDALDSEAIESLHLRVEQLESEVDRLRRDFRRLRRAMRRVTGYLKKEQLMKKRAEALSVTPVRTVPEEPRDPDKTDTAHKPAQGEAVSEEPHDPDETVNKAAGKVKGSGIGNDTPERIPGQADRSSDDTTEMPSKTEATAAINRKAQSSPGAEVPLYRTRGNSEAYESYTRVLAWLDKDELATFKTEMRDWLSRYGDSPHATDAIYWLAETHYIDREWPAARRYYLQLIKRFPQSEKIDEAKLKLADVYRHEKNYEMSRRLLIELHESEDVSIRELASRRLERLQQPEHADTERP